mmetsp:Transcript_85254/g.275146  ORF Transcript_85254/g.275146 Transcript_85254/m.275146 type:complete len:309 (-) Transcript_85254:934-1860(-)
MDRGSLNGAPIVCIVDRGSTLGVPIVCKATCNEDGPESDQAWLQVVLIPSWPTEPRALRSGDSALRTCDTVRTCTSGAPIDARALRKGDSTRTAAAAPRTCSGVAAIVDCVCRVETAQEPRELDSGDSSGMTAPLATAGTGPRPPPRPEEPRGEPPLRRGEAARGRAAGRCVAATKASISLWISSPYVVYSGATGATAAVARPSSCPATALALPGGGVQLRLSRTGEAFRTATGAPAAGSGPLGCVMRRWMESAWTSALVCGLMVGMVARTALTPPHIVGSLLLDSEMGDTSVEALLLNSDTSDNITP